MDQIKKVRFENCNLQESDFSKATMEKVDFRSSDLLDVRVSQPLKEHHFHQSAHQLSPSSAAVLALRLRLAYLPISARAAFIFPPKR